MVPSDLFGHVLDLYGDCFSCGAHQSGSRLVIGGRCVFAYGAFVRGRRQAATVHRRPEATVGRLSF